MTADENALESALDRAWRDQWGRLTALLVAQYRRLDLAEDGLADAFEAAARTWPRDGVPTNPPAWLLTSARRRILDRLRAEAVAARRLPVLAVEAELQEEAQRVMADAGEPVRDERLRLVMLCAHPTLSRENAAALTLRMVMGVSTADIARLFLVPTATMAARLTRSRKSLAGESFEVPVGPDLKARVDRAADVAYLAFTAGYTPPSGAELVRTDLASEAIRLARLLRELLPGRADLDGLLGLMLLQHSRRDARVRDGRLVLLPDQDRAAWHSGEITEALDVLTAHVLDPATPYLVQALIAAEHAIAPHPDATDWPRIVERYDELVALEDTPVVRLNRAVAVSEADGPLAGLRALDGLELPGHRLPGVRGELLARVGRVDEARVELTRAVELCDNDPERAHLAARLAALGDSPGTPDTIRRMRFESVVELGGKTATGIPIPDDVVAALGPSQRPPVTITVNGYTYRTTAVRMGGRFFVPLSAEHREGAGVAAGDGITVDLEPDTAPREVTLPDDLATAMDDDARAAYDALSYTHRKEWVRWVEEAKKPETRATRIEKTVAGLREGRKTH